jgi:hypothetical protein
MLTEAGLLVNGGGRRGSMRATVEWCRAVHGYVSVGAVSSGSGSRGPRTGGTRLPGDGRGGEPQAISRAGRCVAEPPPMTLTDRCTAQRQMTEAERRGPSSAAPA